MVDVYLQGSKLPPMLYLWLVCYEAATVLLLVTVLTWSSSTSTRYHLALSYMYGVFGVSSAGLAVWLVTGRVAGLYVAMLIKLAICPCCSWLIEVHSALPTVGSVLLSGIYVKLGWIGLAKFGMTGTGAPSGTLRSSGCVTGHGGASERLPLGH